MPALPDFVRRVPGAALEQLGAFVGRGTPGSASELAKRINIPYNSTSPAGLIEANTVDPWNDSGKYALSMVYFCVILLFISSSLRFYHFFTDRVRAGLHQEEVLKSSNTASPDSDYEMSVLYTDKSTNKFFPRTGELPQPPKVQSSVSSFAPLNNLIALFRFIFYHPLPQINIKKGWRPIVFPSLGVVCVLAAAFVFTILYTFIPQPLFWESIQYGSPPMAIRSGMLAVSLMPWIIALSMKANFVSLLTGIGHERLNVLHRWGAYLMLILSIIHTVPFYITPVWEDGAFPLYQALVKGENFYPYGTGNDPEFPPSFKALTHCRNCFACASGLFVYPLTSSTEKLDVRALCCCPRSSVYGLLRDAVLALQQLSQLLAFPVFHSCHLDIFLPIQTLLPELDQPQEDVLADWR